MIKEIVLDVISFAALWLIYGGWGVGKTYSLGTLPGRTMIVLAELKNIHRVIGYAKGKYKLFPLRVIEVDNEGNETIRYRTFDELMNQLNQWLISAQKGKKPFDNIAIDSLSALQSIYGEKVEDDAFERRAEETKSERIAKAPILERFYKAKDTYIPLNSVMKRTTATLMNFPLYGINVICTAGIPDNEGQPIEIKPFFVAKEYPSLLNGYFDFVGYVYPKDDEDIYPPLITFQPTTRIKAKCGDTRLGGNVGRRLDWEKIFNVLKQPTQQKEVQP